MVRSAFLCFLVILASGSFLTTMAKRGMNHGKGR